MFFNTDAADRYYLRGTEYDPTMRREPSPAAGDMARGLAGRPRPASADPSAQTNRTRHFLDLLQRSRHRYGRHEEEGYRDVNPLSHTAATRVNNYGLSDPMVGLAEDALGGAKEMPGGYRNGTARAAPPVTSSVVPLLPSATRRPRPSSAPDRRLPRADEVAAASAEPTTALGTQLRLTSGGPPPPPPQRPVSPYYYEDVLARSGPAQAAAAAVPWRASPTAPATPPALPPFSTLPSAIPAYGAPLTSLNALQGTLTPPQSLRIDDAPPHRPSSSSTSRSYDTGARHSAAGLLGVVPTTSASAAALAISAMGGSNISGGLASGGAAAPTAAARAGVRTALTLAMDDAAEPVGPWGERLPRYAGETPTKSTQGGVSSALPLAANTSPRYTEAPWTVEVVLTTLKEDREGADPANARAAVAAADGDVDDNNDVAVTLSTQADLILVTMLDVQPSAPLLRILANVAAAEGEATSSASSRKRVHASRRAAYDAMATFLKKSIASALSLQYLPRDYFYYDRDFRQYVRLTPETAALAQEEGSFRVVVVVSATGSLPRELSPRTSSTGAALPPSSFTAAAGSGARAALARYHPPAPPAAPPVAARGDDGRDAGEEEEDDNDDHVLTGSVSVPLAPYPPRQPAESDGRPDDTAPRPYLSGPAPPAAPRPATGGGVGFSSDRRPFFARHFSVPAPLATPLSASLFPCHNPAQGTSSPAHATPVSAAVSHPSPPRPSSHGSASAGATTPPLFRSSIPAMQQELREWRQRQRHGSSAPPTSDAARDDGDGRDVHRRLPLEEHQQHHQQDAAQVLQPAPPTAPRPGSQDGSPNALFSARRVFRLNEVYDPGQHYYFGERSPSRTDQDDGNVATAATAATSPHQQDEDAAASPAGEAAPVAVSPGVSEGKATSPEPGDGSAAEEGQAEATAKQGEGEGEGTAAPTHQQGHAESPADGADESGGVSAAPQPSPPLPPLAVPPPADDSAAASAVPRFSPQSPPEGELEEPGSPFDMDSEKEELASPVLPETEEDAEENAAVPAQPDADDAAPPSPSTKEAAAEDERDEERSLDAEAESDDAYHRFAHPIVAQVSSPQRADTDESGEVDVEAHMDEKKSPSVSDREDEEAETDAVARASSADGHMAERPPATETTLQAAEGSKEEPAELDTAGELRTVTVHSRVPGADWESLLTRVPNTLSQLARRDIKTLYRCQDDAISSICFSADGDSLQLTYDYTHSTSAPQERTRGMGEMFDYPSLRYLHAQTDTILSVLTLDAAPAATARQSEPGESAPAPPQEGSEDGLHLPRDEEAVQTPHSEGAPLGDQTLQDASHEAEEEEGVPANREPTPHAEEEEPEGQPADEPQELKEGESGPEPSPAEEGEESHEPDEVSTATPAPEPEEAQEEPAPRSWQADDATDAPEQQAGQLDVAHEHHEGEDIASGGTRAESEGGEEESPVEQQEPDVASAEGTADVHPDDSAQPPSDGNNDKDALPELAAAPGEGAAEGEKEPATPAHSEGMEEEATTPGLLPAPAKADADETAPGEEVEAGASLIPPEPAAQLQEGVGAAEQSLSPPSPPLQEAYAISPEAPPLAEMSSAARAEAYEPPPKEPQVPATLDAESTDPQLDPERQPMEPPLELERAEEEEGHSSVTGDAAGTPAEPEAASEAVADVAAGIDAAGEEAPHEPVVFFLQEGDEKPEADVDDAPPAGQEGDGETGGAAPTPEEEDWPKSITSMLGDHHPANPHGDATPTSSHDEPRTEATLDSGAFEDEMDAPESKFNEQETPVDMLYLHVPAPQEDPDAQHEAETDNVEEAAPSGSNHSWGPPAAVDNPSYDPLTEPQPRPNAEPPLPSLPESLGSAKKGPEPAAAAADTKVCAPQETELAAAQRHLSEPEVAPLAVKEMELSEGAMQGDAEEGSADATERGHSTDSWGEVVQPEVQVIPDPEPLASPLEERVESEVTPTPVILEEKQEEEEEKAEEPPAADMWRELGDHEPADEAATAPDSNPFKHQDEQEAQKAECTEAPKFTFEEHPAEMDQRHVEAPASPADAPVPAAISGESEEPLGHVLAEVMEAENEAPAPAHAPPPSLPPPLPLAPEPPEAAVSTDLPTARHVVVDGEAVSVVDGVSRDITPDGNNSVLYLAMATGFPASTAPRAHAVDPLTPAGQEEGDADDGHGAAAATAVAAASADAVAADNSIPPSEGPEEDEGEGSAAAEAQPPPYLAATAQPSDATRDSAHAAEASATQIYSLDSTAASNHAVSETGDALVGGMPQPVREAAYEEERPPTAADVTPPLPPRETPEAVPFTLAAAEPEEGVTNAAGVPADREDAPSADADDRRPAEKPTEEESQERSWREMGDSGAEEEGEKTLAAPALSPPAAVEEGTASAAPQEKTPSHPQDDADEVRDDAPPAESNTIDPWRELGDGAQAPASAAAAVEVEPQPTEASPDATREDHQQPLAATPPPLCGHQEEETMEEDAPATVEPQEEVNQPPQTGEENEGRGEAEGQQSAPAVDSDPWRKMADDPSHERKDAQNLTLPSMEDTDAPRPRQRPPAGQDWEDLSAIPSPSPAPDTTTRFLQKLGFLGNSWAYVLEHHLTELDTLFHSEVAAALGLGPDCVEDVTYTSGSLMIDFYVAVPVTMTEEVVKDKLVEFEYSRLWELYGRMRKAHKRAMKQQQGHARNSESA